MILRFPYLEEPLRGPPPPSMQSAATGRWRPLVPLSLHIPSSSHYFTRVLVDSGADDTIFPLNIANRIGVPLLVVPDMVFVGAAR